MKLIDYLNRDYKLNEPILIEEIDYPDFTHTAIKQALSRLTALGTIKRYARGVYYLPKLTDFGSIKPSADVVLMKKYLRHKGEVTGFYSGLQLLNEVGLTTQVPIERDIITNIEHSKKRTVQVGISRVTLRRPKVQVTADNINLLKLIEIMRYADKLNVDKNIANELVKVLPVNRLSIDSIDAIIELYPGTVARQLIRTGVYHELAS